MKEKKKEKEKQEVNIPLITFPSPESYREIYNQLSEDGKKELDRMMKEGKIKIYP